MPVAPASGETHARPGAPRCRHGPHRGDQARQGLDPGHAAGRAGARLELHYAEQRHLWLRDGTAFARLAPLTVVDDPARWFTLGEPRALPLGSLEVILMRKDPPFDTEYIYSTTSSSAPRPPAPWS